MKEALHIAIIALLLVIGSVFLLRPTPRAFAQGTTISSFTAEAQTTAILVKWTTTTELNNAGFNLLRSTTQGGLFTKVNSALIPSKNPGFGSSYAYSDGSVTLYQTYYYKLETVAFNGSTQQFGLVSACICTPPAPMPDPAARPAEVPEADTLLLFGGGLGGLATWLGWQTRKMRARK